MFGAVVICMTFIADSFVHRYHIKIPEGGSVMILGFLIGLTNHFLGGGRLQKLISFDPMIFHLVLLPLIIFDAGFSLRKRGLFGNFGSILTYAVLGTLLSTFFIGFGVYFLMRGGFGWLDVPMPVKSYECLMFGALISAVDPVASLAVLSKVFKITADGDTETPLVYNIVFGESVLNDAVCIVVYKALESFLSTPYEVGAITLAFVNHYYLPCLCYQILTLHSFLRSLPFRSFYQGIESIGDIIGKFMFVASVSLAIALFMAAFTALLLKHTPLHGNVTHELFFVLFMSYGAYLFAEYAGASGIFCIFFCAIGQSHYGWYNLSEVGQTYLPRTFHSFATLAETMVFAYLGVGGATALVTFICVLFCVAP
jgi:NhaP-type Na+/H+ or K+/H+ antiporter